jgi:hypothetical protein
MGAGETTVDLTGDYEQDLAATIEGGVGEATVVLPGEVGVRVNAEGGLGEINTEGLQRDGESYVNDAYGDSEVTLEVDVRSGVGEINLEVVSGRSGRPTFMMTARRRIRMRETPIHIAHPSAESPHLRIALGACRFKARPGEGDAWVAGTCHDPTDRRSPRTLEEGSSVTITEEEPSFERIPAVFGGVPRYELEFGKQNPSRSRSIPAPAISIWTSGASL